MASYRIDLRRSAEKDLRSIPGRTLSRISDAIDRLAADPRPRGVKSLSGRRNRKRIRVGDYRVLYSVDDRERLVVVYEIKHRREAYRGT